MDVKIYFDTKQSGLTSQENPLDRVWTFTLKELLSHYLQESAVEGRDTFIGGEIFLKAEEEKRVMITKYSYNFNAWANKDIFFQNFKLTPIQTFVKSITMKMWKNVERKDAFHFC